VIDVREVFGKRDWLATVRGVKTRSADGVFIEEAPCNMLLGNAILHLAMLDPSVFSTEEACVSMEGMTLNCRACRRLSETFGRRLAIVE
jgi:hypothetical protein